LTGWYIPGTVLRLVSHITLSLRLIRDFLAEVTLRRRREATGVVSVVAVAIVLFLLLGAVFGLGFFSLEAGTGQRLAANRVRESLDASINSFAVCTLPPV
jgi:hypothetical protein